MPRPLAVCAVFGFVLAATPAQLTVFQSTSRGTLDPDPGSVIGLLVLDLDGDGDRDIMLRGAVFAWYRNDGGGRYTMQPLQNGAPLLPDVQIADVDGDGDEDVYFPVLFRNQRNGLFLADYASLPVIGRLASFTDIDGDGDLDAIIGPTSGGQLRLLTNNGIGVFTDVTLSALGIAANVPFAVFDADRDDDPDILLANGTLLRNDGTGHFLAQVGTPRPVAATALFAGDVDGDGDLDVFARGINSSWLFNDGTGTFTIKPITGQPSLADAKLADLDGDGRCDLTWARDANCWLRNGPGLGLERRPFPAAIAAATSQQLLDFDGDGDLDLAFFGSRLCVQINDHGTFTAWPLEGVTSGFTTRASLASTQVRSRPATAPGMPPRVEVAWLQNGVASLRNSPSEDGSQLLSPVRSPLSASIVSLALFDDGRGFGSSLIGCRIGGNPVWLRRSGIDTLVDATAQLHAIGAPEAVACGDLDGVPGDEAVFGNFGLAGPQILSLDAAGHLRATQPTVPPATPSSMSAFEKVHLADVDGDGDLDILHELRVLLNQGNGNWTVGADFARLLPTNTLDYEPFDLDNDGDQDLVAWTSTTLHVLLNTAGTFSALTTPQPNGLTAIARVDVADVDRDGDLDVLASDATLDRAALLRNDGRATFTVFDSFSAAGALVDVDGDRDPDLFRGDSIAHNLFCQLSAPRPPILGGNYRLDVQNWRFGTPAVAAFLLIGTTVANVDLGLQGTLQVGAQDRLAIGLVLGIGPTSVTAVVPPAPALRGLALASQALLFDQNGTLRLSNLVRDLVR